MEEGSTHLPGLTSGNSIQIRNDEEQPMRNHSNIMDSFDINPDI